MALAIIFKIWTTTVAIVDMVAHGGQSAPSPQLVDSCKCSNIILSLSFSKNIENKDFHVEDNSQELQSWNL